MATDTAEMLRGLLAGPQPANEAISETLRAFDARQLVTKKCPLAALAFHAMAIAAGRSDIDRTDTSLIAELGEEARRALEASGIDLTLLDSLYPDRSIKPATALAHMLARSARR